MPADAESAAVFHASAPDLDEAVSRVAEVTGVRPTISLIGPVTGSHLGLGALGVAAVARP
jgi:fatty acid-binding protein DegV